MRGHNNAVADTVTQRLFLMQDVRYRDFNSKLIPTVPKDRVIGVRTPLLKALAKELYGTEEARVFMKTLPHAYFEENNLHAFLIERIKDPLSCIEAIEEFLPYVDNWATCDQLCPKSIGMDKTLLERKAFEWIESGKEYTVRFGISMLMRFFLDGDFNVKHLEKVASVRSDEYYVNMMQAWYFATALAKRHSDALPYIENGILPVWVHNKTVQKAVESYRISDDQKEYLRTLKRKEK